MPTVELIIRLEVAERRHGEPKAIHTEAVHSKNFPNSKSKATKWDWKDV